jgi:hypothetical protein
MCAAPVRPRAHTRAQLAAATDAETGEPAAQREQVDALVGAVDAHTADAPELVDAGALDALLARAAEDALRPIARDLRARCDDVVAQAHASVERSRDAMQRVLELAEKMSRYFAP